MHTYKGSQIYIYIFFVDYEKAFGSVEHSAVLNSLLSRVLVKTMPKLFKKYMITELP